MLYVDACLYGLMEVAEQGKISTCAYDWEVDPHLLDCDQNNGTGY